MDKYNILSKTKPLVYVSKSKISGLGLFAKKNISKHNPVVIYYGDHITDDEIYKLYTTDPHSYLELSPYIRGTPNGFAIKGCRNQTNKNLLGVFVNDISLIDCKKEDINRGILQNYANTEKKCNLSVVDTDDYPVYFSKRRIIKGEELFVHYGIGYWLSIIGFSPEEISDLNKKYKFESFYL
jgi:hypothetical protein